MAELMALRSLAEAAFYWASQAGSRLIFYKLRTHGMTVEWDEKNLGVSIDMVLESRR
ncbi:MAG: hypothetical protein Cons2KO_19620 [Congregibacter sp.]